MRFEILVSGIMAAVSLFALASLVVMMWI